MAGRLRKAVFPVAGLGTRFLPATKAIPKEMLPILDRPLIEYAVDEARAAGIEEFIFVTGRGKVVLEDHFDLAFELEATLAARGKDQVIAGLRAATPAPGAIVSVRQQEPLGLGHAVWCARNLIGDEPFAVLLPDDLLLADPPCLALLADHWRECGGNVFTVMDVPREMTDRYGIADVGTERNGRMAVHGLVEKPEPTAAPSTLAVVGRYVLQPEVFEILCRHERGAGGEIQLTDAMAALIARQPFHAVRFDGQRFDCGNPLGFLEANVAVALSRDELSADAASMLRRRLATVAG